MSGQARLDLGQVDFLELKGIFFITVGDQHLLEFIPDSLLLPVSSMTASLRPCVLNTNGGGT